jgi:hypothetical protein
MKRILLTPILVLLVTLHLPAQERKITSTIDKVTVFIEGAQIERKAALNLPAGTHEITIPGLTPLLNPATLQTKGTSNLEILSVRTGKVLSEGVSRSEKEDSLKLENDWLEGKMAILNASLEVLEEEKDLLIQNKELPVNGSGAWAERLRETADFYRSRLQEISLEAIKLKRELTEIQSTIEVTNRRLAELPDEVPEEKTEVYLEIKINRAVRDTLSLTYQVAQARWFPEYDFRITDLKNPLNIEYKAKISQQTGEDWKDVKLIINTGSPNQASRAPQVATWWLRPDYERYHSQRSGYSRKSEVTSSGYFNGIISGKVISTEGEGIPGVSVIIPGSTIGTVTEIDGSYSLQIPYGTTHLSYQYIGLETIEHLIDGSRLDVVMVEDVTQLSEVVVTAIGIGSSDEMHSAINRSPVRLSGKVPGVAITGSGGNAGSNSNITIRGQASVSDYAPATIDLKPAPKEFLIDERFSLVSDPKPKQIRLENYEVAAIYNYQAIPRKDNRAYLKANVTDWQSLNMLDGTANLFLENTFLGRIPFVKDQLDDTLQIDLGPDPKVQVSFETVKDLSGTQFLGSKKKEDHVYEIKIRNGREFAIVIEVIDLIPIPSLSSVDVDRIGDGGDYDKEEGIIRWDIKLPPSESKTIRTGFELKYPSHIKLQL